MNLFTKLKHSLLGRPQPRVTQVAPPDASGMRIDELPPFSVQTADLMRFDPQVRIGLGARNGLLMAAEVEVDGEERVRQWVQHQWDALWHAAAHQLLRGPSSTDFRRSRWSIASAAADRLADSLKWSD